MPNQDDKTAPAIEIQEIDGALPEAELAEAIGGALTLTRDRVISQIQKFAFGDVTFKVDRIRQGVAMLQSGHTPTPDIEAFRGAISTITRNRL